MLPPASGIGVINPKAAKVIRFLRVGCTNRPFFHLVVAERKNNKYQPVIEQLGAYDPLPNQYNEKLVSLNLERIRQWIGNGAHLSKPAEQLLGLAGFYPIHPTSYITAWRSRQKQKKDEEIAEKEVSETVTS